jgi:RNA polymerase sigma-70 factor, ECF subfamily
MTDFARAGHSPNDRDVPPVVGQMPEHQAPTAEPDNFAQIFRAHAAFVWRVLRRQGLGDADAEDATQEVFLVVHRRLGEYEERGAIRAWLFTICRQVASHHRRTNDRTERKQQALMLTTDDRANPHDLVERSEAVALVRRFLDGLDEAHATVFYLAEIEGMTAPEVASATGVNLNTVYGRLRSARKRFEEALGEHK